MFDPQISFGGVGGNVISNVGMWMLEHSIIIDLDSQTYPIQNHNYHTVRPSNNCLNLWVAHALKCPGLSDTRSIASVAPYRPTCLAFSANFLRITQAVNTSIRWHTDMAIAMQDGPYGPDPLSALCPPTHQDCRQCLGIKS